jgi:hypothetical protein
MHFSKSAISFSRSIYYYSKAAMLASTLALFSVKALTASASAAALS